MPAGKRQAKGGWRTPSLRGVLMIDTTRGSLRIRSWPKPRPGPRHPTNEFWTKWLKAVTYVYRYQPAMIQWQLQQATKGTVWMPRDIFISAARGRAWLLQDDLGRTYFPMPYVQDVSDSLDAIGQLTGMMLYRGENLWVPIPAGNPNTFLKAGATPEDVPTWASADAGGYLIQRLVANITDQNYNINSTNYIALQNFRTLYDFDAFTPSQFRFYGRAASNQAGQTIKVQLCDVSAPTVPLSAAGDDLTITSAVGFVDSGWINFDTVPSGEVTIGPAFKGSNATVDMTWAFFDLHLK